MCCQLIHLWQCAGGSAPPSPSKAKKLKGEGNSDSPILLSTPPASQEPPRRSSRLLNKPGSSENLTETPTSVPGKAKPRRLPLEVKVLEATNKRRKCLDTDSESEVTEVNREADSKTKKNKDKKEAEAKRESPKKEVVVPPTVETEKKPIHPFFLPRSQQPKPSIKISENPFKLTEGEDKPLFFLPNKERVEKLNERSQKKLKEDVCTKIEIGYSSSKRL